MLLKSFQELAAASAPIMNGHLGSKLSFSGKLLLASIALAAVAAPLAVGLVNAPPVRAQEPQTTAAPAPAFDQVSIKLSNPTDNQSHLEIQPFLFVQTNATVKSLIAFAYEVQEFQLSGAPDWVGLERFDIEVRWKESPNAAGRLVASPASPPPADAQFIAVGSATSTVLPPPPSPLPPGAMATHLRPFQLQTMLQTLLAERFNLKLSHESRDLPVYNLVVADTGSKLTPALSSPAPPVAPSGRPTVTVRSAVRNGDHEFALTNAAPAVFADLLSQKLGRQVVDKTGLKGQFDITIQWAKGETEPDSISSAMEEQLGLKIEPDQGPVEVLVVEQIEKPATD